MPLYDMKCTQCGESFEYAMKVSELKEKEVKCYKCDGKAEVQISLQKATHSTWKYWRS